MELNLNKCLTNSKLNTVLEKPDEKPPFNLYVFQDLISDEKIVQQLRDDINSYVKLKKKDNDLYKFKQSKDLLSETPAKKLTPTMLKFFDAIQDDVKRELEKLTGKQLSSKNFDITASRYDEGNYLLCHNDDIKDNLRNHRRALAFVFYLNTRPWTKQDGGSLILYESDSTGEPVKVSNTISPKPNSLVVFETTETSWHSVEEVLCKDDFRLSINGWFHTDNMPAAKTETDDRLLLLEKPIESSPYTFVRPIALDEKLENFFRDYFNPEYLMEKTCLLVKRRFKRDSEINLINFLNKEKFEEINEALRKTVCDEENLQQVGPYNKRNYRRIRMDKLPQVCKDLHEAFRSELFFMYLSRITGLDLQPPSIKADNKANSSKCSGSESGDDDDDEEEDDDDDEESDEDESDEDLDLEDESGESNDDGGDGKENGEHAKVNGKEGGGGEGTSNKTQQSIVDQYKDGSSTKTTAAAAAADSSEKSEPTTSKQERSQEADKSENKPAKKRRRTTNPLARLEFRHLDAGSYTLIHDYGFEMGEKSALDVILHFNHDFEVNLEHGGYISYIDCAPEEDPHDMEHELLTVEPKSNCLSLAYRCDGETCRFLKYMTKSHKSPYQDLYGVYYERSDDLPAKSVTCLSSELTASGSDTAATAK